MEREAHKSRSFADADRWDKEQHWAMTPDERFAIWILGLEDLKRAKKSAGRPKDLDDLDHLRGR